MSVATRLEPLHLYGLCDLYGSYLEVDSKNNLAERPIRKKRHRKFTDAMGRRDNKNRWPKLEPYCAGPGKMGIFGMGLYLARGSCKQINSVQKIEVRMD